MSMMIPATEARKNFAELLDEAFTKPVFINRRKTDYLTFSTSQLGALLSITPVLEGVDGDYAIFIKEIPPVIGFGKTIEEAMNDLGYSLMDYGDMYLSNLDKYYQAPNTKPFLLYAVMFKDLVLDEFKEQLNAKLERT